MAIPFNRSDISWKLYSNEVRPSDGTNEISIIVGDGSSNRVRVGDGAFTIPVGPSSERPPVAQQGMIRYNSDLDYLEFYDSASQSWNVLGQKGPSITGVSPTILPENIETSFTLTGTNFSRSGVTVVLVASDSSVEYSVDLVSVVSEQSAVFTIAADNPVMSNLNKSPFAVKLTNIDINLSATLSSAITGNFGPFFISPPDPSPSYIGFYGVQDPCASFIIQGDDIDEHYPLTFTQTSGLNAGFDTVTQISDTSSVFSVSTRTSATSGDYTLPLQITDASGAQTGITNYKLRLSNPDVLGISPTTIFANTPTDIELFGEFFVRDTSGVFYDPCGVAIISSGDPSYVSSNYVFLKGVSGEEGVYDLSLNNGSVVVSGNGNQLTVSLINTFTIAQYTNSGPYSITYLDTVSGAGNTLPSISPTGSTLLTFDICANSPTSVSNYFLTFDYPTNIEYLLVGGGGGGGGGDAGNCMGGGGAGAVVAGSFVPNAGVTDFIQVGGGGLGYRYSTNSKPSDGSPTIVAGIVAIGGGRGSAGISSGDVEVNAPNGPWIGGSGGGGSGAPTSGAYQLQGAPSTLNLYGNKGGDGGNTGNAEGYKGGGGGGAGAVGQSIGDPATNNLCNGGDGIQSAISGTNIYYGGGGGGGGIWGGWAQVLNDSTGGLGGGGSGGGNSTTSGTQRSGTAGTDGLGGGGGADGYQVPDQPGLQLHNRGGAGRIMLRFPSVYKTLSLNDLSIPGQSYPHGVTKYYVTSSNASSSSPVLDGYTVFMFKTATNDDSHTFSITPNGTFDVSAIVVGAGGGGGGQVGGGGGAGSVEFASGTLTQGNTYSVIIGAGGAGGNKSNRGANGQNSQIDLDSQQIIGSGGGGGGAQNGDLPSSGGSGGGGADGDDGAFAGSGSNVNAGGQSFGGNGEGGGGGGGSASAGFDGDKGLERGGNGGQGIVLNILGFDRPYYVAAGGGGGGELERGFGGTSDGIVLGGYGGSDNGLGAEPYPGNGSGGGGGSRNSSGYTGARGSSGVAFIRIPTFS